MNNQYVSPCCRPTHRPKEKRKVYGGLYNDYPQTLDVLIGNQEIVLFNNSMPGVNVNYNNQTITPLIAGTYEINWKLICSVSVAVGLTMAIRRNGINIPSTVVTRIVELGTETLFSGSVIVTLDAGDKIDMALSSLLAVLLTLGSGTNATLTIKKIDDKNLLSNFN